MEDSKIKLFKSLTVFSMVGAVLVGAMIISEVKSYRFIGGGVTATNTISVSGEGEVMAVPDIATISFTVQEEAKTVSSAQDKATAKTKTVLAELKKVGIADKDIKTQNYSSNPKYEWQQETIVCITTPCPSHPGRQVIVGYQVSQSVSVTVRNLDLVNDAVAALGQSEVSNMYGPNFAIDKEDDLKAEARKIAIEKARTKAEVLARDLGVTLVRVVSFSEGGDYPIYARTIMSDEKVSYGMGGGAPELPRGEEKITSNVTVTYEIR